jgi:hypothetical protein
MKTLRVLLPAVQVPCGSVVTKKAGIKEYTIKDTIKIYHTQWIQEVKSLGMVFLVAKGGDINAIAATAMVLAELTLAQIKELMEDDNE